MVRDTCFSNLPALLQSSEYAGHHALDTSTLFFSVLVLTCEGDSLIHVGAHMLMGLHLCSLVCR